mgnify:CR=1 FL=1
MKKLAMHWKILIGMILGLLFGLLMKNLEQKGIVVDWIKPFGTIFINLLKMIAVPLIVVSLIVGLADLKDISKFSKLGGRTVLFYLCSTVIAVSIGLGLANLIKPGRYINKESRESLIQNFSVDASQKIQMAETAKKSGPLQPLIDIVPDNFFKALSDNGSMLQVILFVILLGIGLILVDEKKAKPVVDFFKGLNEVIMKIIDIIMLFSPYGVFALMASLMVEIPDFSTNLRIDCCIRVIYYGFYFLSYLVIDFCKSKSNKIFQSDRTCPIVSFFYKFKCCYITGNHGMRNRTCWG